MRYDPMMTKPFRDEVTKLGVRELTTPEEVDSIAKTKGTALIFVNSVCGCAGGAARPGLAFALKHGVKPDVVSTVFAGQDIEATERARSYFTGYAPSSPSFGLLKDGKLVSMIERRQIEGQPPQAVAEMLKSAFDKHCSSKTTVKTQ
ncbi:MAG: BrxA/BrxB family bacilliredoxin [Planctomycetes bacterium]|nr:BrxA/BrxB family bacilliredoxin [Planctomycetota bacterium]